MTLLPRSSSHSIADLFITLKYQLVLYSSSQPISWVLCVQPKRRGALHVRRFRALFIVGTEEPERTRTIYLAMVCLPFMSLTR